MRRIDLPDFEPFTVEHILFGTDRAWTGDTAATSMFDGRRGRMAYGVCEVTIPSVRPIGGLDASPWWRLTLFGRDKSRDVTLGRVVVTTRDDFITLLRDNISARPGGDALLFVHGYNVTFEDAARRTGQLAHDLRIAGAAAFFSWPSQGKVTSYTVDEQNIEWAESDFQQFLMDFIQRGTFERLFLIGHSMGSRTLTRALVRLDTERPDLRKKVSEIILAAPDIDADVFKRSIAPAIIAANQRMTVYASSSDQALAASKELHGDKRLGQAGAQITVVSGVETIDASAVDTSLIGHSYFAETRSIVTDMFYLLSQGLRASKRAGLIPKESQNGPYWLMEP